MNSYTFHYQDVDFDGVAEVTVMNAQGKVAHLWISQYNSTHAVIEEVHVYSPEHRRQGLATAMLTLIEERSGLVVQHSGDRTPDGMAWSATTGRG